jgi:hypothetical protein
MADGRPDAQRRISIVAHRNGDYRQVKADLYRYGDEVIVGRDIGGWLGHWTCRGLADAPEILRRVRDGWTYEISRAELRSILGCGAQLPLPGFGAFSMNAENEQRLHVVLDYIEEQYGFTHTDLAALWPRSTPVPQIIADVAARFSVEASESLIEFLTVLVLGWLPKTTVTGGARAMLNFVSGYGASIIREPVWYSGEEVLFELAVTRDGHITYETPITFDVLRGNSPREIIRLVLAISRLTPEQVEAYYHERGRLAREELVREQEAAALLEAELDPVPDYDTDGNRDEYDW